MDQCGFEHPAGCRARRNFLAGIRAGLRLRSASQTHAVNRLGLLAPVLSPADGARLAHSATMEIQIATLCDAATDYNGKLNLLGTFDTIFASATAGVHMQCLSPCGSFAKIEEGAHKVKINFIDEDGKFIMPSIDMPIEVAMPEEASFQSRNFIVNIHQLKFESPANTPSIRHRRAGGETSRSGQTCRRKTKAAPSLPDFQSVIFNFRPQCFASALPCRC